MTDSADTTADLARAAAIARGTLRLLADLGLCGIQEMTLANNRRADIAALGPGGDVWMVEIKSGVPDFRSDSKWPEYMPFCDRFWFAVDHDFPQELIPEEAGLIVADAFGAAVVREAPTDRLSPARRKAVTLRLARLAAMRLSAAADTGWTASEAALTSSGS
ncbi:MAG: MmcB family DNA repair protein [Rhodobacterales bacterium]|nr:MmcB family DNA repair protein [Rhodobacterales bacterium]